MLPPVSPAIYHHPHFDPYFHFTHSPKFLKFKFLPHLIPIIPFKKFPLKRPLILRPYKVPATRRYGQEGIIHKQTKSAVTGLNVNNNIVGTNRDLNSLNGAIIGGNLKNNIKNNNAGTAHILTNTLNGGILNRNSNINLRTSADIAVSGETLNGNNLNPTINANFGRSRNVNPAGSTVLVNEPALVHELQSSQRNSATLGNSINSGRNTNFIQTSVNNNNNQGNNNNRNNAFIDRNFNRNINRNINFLNANNNNLVTGSDLLGQAMATTNIMNEQLGSGGFDTRNSRLNANNNFNNNNMGFRNGIAGDLNRGFDPVVQVNGLLDPAGSQLGALGLDVRNNRINGNNNNNNNNLGIQTDITGSLDRGFGPQYDVVSASIAADGTQLLDGLPSDTQLAVSLSDAGNPAVSRSQTSFAASGNGEVNRANMNVERNQYNAESSLFDTNNLLPGTGPKDIFRQPLTGRTLDFRDMVPVADLAGSQAAQTAGTGQGSSMTEAAINNDLAGAGTSSVATDIAATDMASAKAASALEQHAAAFDSSAAGTVDLNAATPLDVNAGSAVDPISASIADPNVQSALDFNAGPAVDPNAPSAIDQNAGAATSIASALNINAGEVTNSGASLGLGGGNRISGTIDVVELPQNSASGKPLKASGSGQPGFQVFEVTSNTAGIPAGSTIHDLGPVDVFSVGGSVKGGKGLTAKQTGNIQIVVLDGAHVDRLTGGSALGQLGSSNEPISGGSPLNVGAQSIDPSSIGTVGKPVGSVPAQNPEVLGLFELPPGIDFSNIPKSVSSVPKSITRASAAH